MDVTGLRGSVHGVLGVSGPDWAFMTVHSIRLFLAALLCSVALGGCNLGVGSSAPPPSGGLTVAPGNGYVTISWNADVGVEYWLVYAPTTSIATSDTTWPAGHTWVMKVTSPYVLSGLTNGTLYSFAMNGRIDGGQGGASTASVSATPRASGGYWSAGSAMAQDMHGIAYGTASDSTADYVAVGNAGAIYQGLDGVTWTAVTGQTANFTAAVYAFSNFVALDDTGNFYRSTDIATWTAGTNAGARMNAVATNSTLAVAVGQGGRIYTSADAITWTAATSSQTVGTQDLYGVTYSNTGVWVAVGSAGAIYTSTDGDTWVDHSMGGNTLRAVAVLQSGTVFTYVAVGLGGAGWISSDGTTWTSLGGSGLAGDFYALDAANDQFVAVGAAGIAFASANGSAWAQTTPTGGGTGVVSTAASGAQTLYALKAVAAQLVAVGATGVNITSK